MNVAVLMHGLAGTVDKYNTGKNLPVNLSHKHFKKHILNVNEDVNINIDVFMHSWSTELEKELVQLYHPTLHKFEPQIIFDFEYIVGNPNGPGGPIVKWHDGKFRGLDNIRFHSMFSKWYSAKVVNFLKTKYEKTNSFEYDLVMLTRYDLAYIKDFKFLDMSRDHVYLTAPDGGHHGVHDFWIISNSKDADSIYNGMFDLVRKIEHFPGKFTHNHFWLKKYLETSKLLNKVEFVGPPRHWSNGTKTGPSPPIREWYGLSIATPDSDMELERQRIKKISKKLVRNTPTGEIEIIKIK